MNLELHFLVSQNHKAASTAELNKSSKSEAPDNIAWQLGDHYLVCRDDQQTVGRVEHSPRPSAVALLCEELGGVLVFCLKEEVFFHFTSRAK